MRTDVLSHDRDQHEWVKKNIDPHKNFDTQKEKEMFKEARQECLKKNVASRSVVKQLQNPRIYGIPFSMDHTNKEQPLEKVSTIYNFPQSCVKLLND